MRERGEIPSALCLVPPVQRSFGFARGAHGHPLAVS